MQKEWLHVFMSFVFFNLMWWTENLSAKIKKHIKSNSSCGKQCEHMIEIIFNSFFLTKIQQGSIIATHSFLFVRHRHRNLQDLKMKNMTSIDEDNAQNIFTLQH